MHHLFRNLPPTVHNLCWRLTSSFHMLMRHVIRPYVDVSCHPSIFWCVASSSHMLMRHVIHPYIGCITSLFHVLTCQVIRPYVDASRHHSICWRVTLSFHVLTCDVTQIRIWVIFSRKCRTTVTSGRQELPFFAVPPFHSSILEPDLHLRSTTINISLYKILLWKR